MKVKLMFLFILGQPNRIEATMDILSIPSLDEIKEVKKLRYLYLDQGSINLEGYGLIISYIMYLHL